MNNAENERLNLASIEWQNNEPFSREYDDVYYSREDGLEESKYVFYDSNNLDDRLLDSENSSTFVICETGFGTGLNFLLTWSLWDKLPCKNKRPLHFISIEKHPLSAKDLNIALNNWPSLNKYADELIKQYPYLVKGQHRLTFNNGKIVLTLLFGDINQDFSDHVLNIDCWYLDGFAPSKNSDMWSKALFSKMRVYSNKNASFSTFTAASIVRKGLISAGFEVFKKKGFGRKREMIYGHINSELPTPKHQISHNAKWSLPEFNSKAYYGTPKNTSADYDAVIIGGGLAGLSTAYSLTQKGLNVAIIEKKASLISGASGQDQLVMYAKPPTEYNKVYKFIEHSLCHSLRHYKHLQDHIKEHHFWHNTGLLQLAWSEKEEQKHKRFVKNIQLPSNLIRLLPAKEASDKVGIPLLKGGLWFEDAGWLCPGAYQEAIKQLCSNNLSILTAKTVNHFHQGKDKSWIVNTDTESISCNYLILCNSNDATSFKQLSHFPIKPLRGQVTSIKKNTLQAVKSVVCGEGYLCPSVDNWHHIGATFDLDSKLEKIKAEDNVKNLTNIAQWFPEWGDPLDYKEIRAKAGLRCTTPDYLPVVGQAPKYEVMIERFSKLRVDANSCSQYYGEYYENLFVNIGHGSKGLFTTPLSAEIIASMICRDPLPLNETMRAMLSPARFIIKHLKQRRI